MAEFQLGDRVKFRNVLSRHFRAHSKPNKVWDSFEYRGADPANRREGVVVGLRTLANGDITFGGYDEPTTFRATEHFPAVLIAHSLRAKPVLVRPCDVELIANTDESES